MFTLNQLLVFKRVVETGSFNKAAPEEFVSTNAVMKQINRLEQEVGVQLLVRSHKGAELTQAGISFYEDTIKILSNCEGAIDRAKALAGAAIPPVRFGTSLANRPDDLGNLLTKVLEKHPEIKIEMVPFENTPDATSAIYSNLGGRADVVASSFDEGTKAYWEFDALEVSKMPICIVAPKTHVLSEKSVIGFDDLKGETLLLVRRGYSKCLDDIRIHIEEHCPDINIIDVPAFGMELYNKAVNENVFTLGIGDSIKGHPLTNRVRLDWKGMSSFGILYAPNPSKHVQRFLEAVKECLDE